ncbi:MAG: collagen binding domain-containing protein, partial [Phycisphaerae bacterium]
MIAKNNRSMLGVGLALLISATTAYGQCPPGEVQINGEVYEGTGTVTYTLNAVGESIAHRNAVLAPLAPPLTPAANDVRVMIQNMDGGAFVAYGTFAPASNGWSACVPEGGSYIAMFSATGHDLTSRVYDVPLGYVAPAVVPQSYLPALHLNIDTGVVNAATEPMQPLGNVLVYAFEENMVNGAPDWPMDPGLPGVFMELYDPRTGVVVSSGYTIDGNGGPTAITTKDGLVFGGQMAAGHLYMQDIPPGEYRLRATPPNALDANGNAWTGGWYHTYTMEGTQEWEILIYPGDPGTEAGGFMAWFGFVKKVGQIATTVPGSTISGTLQDADVAFEVPIAGEPPEAGAPLDPAYRNQGVFPNGPIPDGFLVLWRLIGNTPELIATTDADPVTGAFSINNVPAGQYYIFFVDKPLNYIFGEMNFTVDGINPLVLPPITQEIPGAPLAISARFFARVQGFVVDDATGIGIGGATVNIRYRAGNVPFSTVTEPNGWYNFDALPEIETMAMIDVEPPPGYRGSFVTDTYFPTAAVPPDPNCTGFPNCPLVPTPCDPTVDPTCVVPGASLAVQRNGMGRYVQWYTANYKSDLILEPVPATAGHVQGLVFNDSLATGTWVADGIYDKAEEPVVEGAVIQLLDATGGIIPLIDAVTGLPVVDPITGLPVQDPATVSASGAYDKAGAVAQGYILPGISVPPDEWGGFFSGPMPGFYEFRDVAPGDYFVRITPPNGFCAGINSVPITVTDGGRNDVNLGLHTAVPRAGTLEGGVFADQVLDQRWFSAFAEEKQLLVGIGVTVRDFLGYTLDTLVQPSGVCYPGTVPVGNPGGVANKLPNQPYGAICDRP